MRDLLCIIQMVLFMSCGDRDALVDKSKLLGNDYRLFQGTPVWNLAKAVQDEKVDEIKRIVQEEKVNVDYQEKKFGNTLLMLTVDNQHYNSCKALLELGANPNKHDNYNGTSAIVDASNIENYKDDNTKFIKLLLEYGGNPNDEETGKRQEGNTTRKTPLLAACSDVNQFVSPIEKVKVLVDAGANVNYKNEFNDFPLAEAVMHKHYDAVLYLLQKGADYSLMLFDRAEFSEGGKKMYIADLLREDLLHLDSKKYQQKMRVVEFLKEKGIDYRKVPIPDFVIKEAKETYPKNWKEYLEKY
ncbi:MAG TPA: ankyrin repeat domain-containing protein [Flavitalea sp.]|nr:ankyrin repeat domain-containing protein [Flavitalea sp.]